MHTVEHIENIVSGGGHEDELWAPREEFRSSVPSREEVPMKQRVFSVVLTCLTLSACSGEGVGGPVRDGGSGDAGDGAAEGGARVDSALPVVECGGVPCTGNQVCLYRCSATRTPDGTACHLGGPPTGPVEQCVDLPGGCSPANACGCLRLDLLCPTTGAKVFRECESQGPRNHKCLCGCSF